MSKSNKISIKALFANLNNKKNFVFLDTSLYDKSSPYSLLFIEPLQVISTNELSKIKQCFKLIESQQKKGLYLAGFVSYEAGYAFNDRVSSKNKYDFPLLWMGVYKKPFFYDNKKQCFKNNDLFEYKATTTKQKYKISNLKINISEQDYLNNIKKIKKLIEAGDTYQVNYTTKLKFDFKGNDLSCYEHLRNNQKVKYSAFIKTDSFSILSFSPELFFNQKHNKIYVCPMKGTMARGKNNKEDIKMQKMLKNDSKNQAENIMIVDLLRNDLGKISKTSTVKTTKLFNVEKYKTLLQMTSTVEGKLKDKTTIYDIFSSLYPSGSVTGAPKIRTMQIIKDLEKEERKIYTGSIGYITKNDVSIFNVAIRTIVLEKNKGEMGIGSGITYSSSGLSEWKECKLKSNFLVQKPFCLIETMLCSKKDEIFLLDLHLKRLKKSAKFFFYNFSEKLIKNKIKTIISSLPSNKQYKLRLLLDAAGEIKIEASVLKKPSKKIEQICLSKHRLNDNNIFLYHKTTNRRLYNNEFKKYKKNGFFDVIFLNKKNEVCEGAISNIFIKKKGVYYTPSLSSGLLPGVFREFMLSSKKFKTKEKILTLEDLKTADKIYCANSVRKLVEVKLIEE